MPLNILIGIISVLVALVLYTVGTFRGRRAARFTRGRLSVLWLGVAFDVLATVMMGLQVGGLDLRPGMPLVHTVLALLAWAGMTVGTALGTWAFLSGRRDVQRTVSTWLVAPWALWVAVFVWGMVTRGAERMVR